MSVPFGFGPGTGGSGDAAPFFRELEKLLSWQGGPVNWDLAAQLAQRSIAENDPPVTDGDREETTEALRLADMWLDEVTALPSGVTRTEAWSRRAWLEQTLGSWRELCDPVAGRVAESMSTSLTAGLQQLSGGDVPAELEGMLPPGMDLANLASQSGPMAAMVRQMGGLMFGAQVGQALGALAAEVTVSTEVGIVLGPLGTAALLPAGVAAFGAGLEQPLDQVRLYLALREAAHQRLFAHVPWLRGHLVGMITDFARGISIDTDAINRAMQSLGTIDATDPEAVQQALGAGVFSPETTPAQQAALTRLETGLALVEGWVDEVVAAAADGKLPGAVALREAVRRRRASGGPAERTFSELVGLQLRPRRLREAATLWAKLREQRGVEGRDAVWATPDLLPSGADLENPDGFLAGDDAAPGDVDTSGLDDPIAAIEALGDTGPREDD